MVRTPLLNDEVLPALSSKADIRISKLPKVARAVAERLGYDVGLELMTKLGGRQITVPTKTSRATRCAMYRTLGEPATLVMIELFGGESLSIPKGVASRSSILRAAILAHQGSNNAAAIELGVTSRWVRMVRAAARKTKRAALRSAFERDEKRINRAEAATLAKAA